jgi:hypothetical protein
MYRKFEREAALYLSQWHLGLLCVGGLDDGKGELEGEGIF